MTCHASGLSCKRPVMPTKEASYRINEDPSFLGMTNKQTKNDKKTKDDKQTKYVKQKGMNLEENKSLKIFLDERVKLYNQPAFIEKDPVSIPHHFTLKQDIEISGLFAAVFSWGNRTTIIQKSKELMGLMDNAPHDFILHHREKDLEKLVHFAHRTFNSTDLLYFTHFLHHHYSGKIHPGKKTAPNHVHKDPGKISLESAFKWYLSEKDADTGNALRGFYQYFFSLPDAPPRTHKHIASPDKDSACKRLNMYLRWMVRKDKQGVDFGIWKSISPSQLVCPLDLHVARVARRFGLIIRPQADWATAVELTENLKRMDPADPVKYDFALFGLGIEERY